MKGEKTMADIALSDTGEAIKALDIFINKLKAAKKVSNAAKYKLLASRPASLSPTAKDTHSGTGAIGCRFDEIDGVFYPLQQAAKYAKTDTGKLLAAKRDNAVYSIVIGGALLFPQSALDMYINLY